MASVTAQRALVDGKTLELTNLDKVLWPDPGFTKGHLVQYYAEIGPTLLPHLKDRPLTITRYPDGIDKEGFYQKDCPHYAPDWIRTHRVIGKEKPIDYVMVDSTATLVWLANQAAIEIHPWLSRYDEPDLPDYAVVDLDPAIGATFADVIQVARYVKETLDELGLIGFPKVSGATGLHVYVPILRRYPYAITSRFVGAIGKLIVRLLPDRATNERLVKARIGKVYIDHLQNLPGKTIAAPYSLRPLPGAPVSFPVSWEELDHVRPNQFRLPDALNEVRRTGDTFAAVLRYPQNLDCALQRLGVE